MHLASTSGLVALGIVVGLQAFGCAQEAPATLLVELRATPGVGQLDELRLSVFGERGIELDAYRLPTRGAPALPDTVVLYPPRPELLRLLLRGRRGDRVVAEATTTARSVAATQTPASLTLDAGARPDRDGDGVPDAIDICPELPNPEQAPCSATDGAIDGVDGGADGAHDGVREGPLLPDVFVPPDIFRPCKVSADCSDGNACTDDRCEGGLCTYGPTVCTASGDPCRQAPRCDPSLGCVEDAKPDGTACTDTSFCTVEERCQSGHCQTKVRDCSASAPPCSTASCNEPLQRCDYAAVAAGTVCDDGDACTQGDVCTTTAGQCAAPPTSVTTVEPRNVDRRGARTVVIDSQGAVHALYAESTSGQTSLRYLTNRTGSWVGVTLEGPGIQQGRTPSLAIDAQDTLHAAYRSASMLRYRRFGAGALNFVENATASDSDTAIAVTASGTVYIAHAFQRGLHLATRPPGTVAGWTDSAIYTPANSTEKTGMLDLVVGAQGSLHITHAREAATDLLADRLWHSSNETGSWVTTTVSAVAGAGHMPSVQVDGQGTVYIAHGLLNSLTTGSLRLETRDPQTKGWSTQTLAASNQGSFPTLMLGAANHLHVVHRDFGTGRLLHQTNASGAWSVLAIDTHPSAGRWASAVRGPDGRFHAIYELQTGSEVRYATFSSCQ